MLYPLKFAPILKDKIWGGSKLKNSYNRQTDSDKLGESWELSGYEGDESLVTNGFLKGNNLTELIETYMGDLVGDKIFDKFGLSFPLLFKLIDANENLSIQVHPDDETAAERHNSFGKTEMWYVVEAEPDGKLIIGFKEDCTKEAYLEALADGKVEDLLQSVPVKRGDVFFIPAGQVHAIGKGVVVAEIQESSDITYRIYDYKRKDDQGNERELHTGQALDVINFKASKNPKTGYHAVLNKVTPLVSCEFFTTNMLNFDKKVVRDYAKLDSFAVYMCLEGSFTIDYPGGQESVAKGDTILIPAAINEAELTPLTNEVSLLEVYVS
jgi:mannose-6-phosphate isomerase